MKNIYKTLLLCVLFFNTNLLCGHTIKREYNSGLTFKSYKVNKDERTCLNLTPDKPLVFSKDFQLEFDVKFRWKESNFGYVFRFIANDTISLDMLVSNANQRASFYINSVRDTRMSTYVDFTRHISEESWEHITIKTTEDSIFIQIGENSIKEYCPADLFQKKNISIFFGASKHKDFYTTDTPEMTIRNIILKNEDKTVRSWDMMRHANNVVYDSVADYPASVVNGVWNINNHAIWKKEYRIPLQQQFTQIAYDTSQSRIFAADTQSLYIYHLSNHLVTYVPVLKGKPYIGVGSFLVYDDVSHSLRSYNTYTSGFNSFDFETREWSVDHNFRTINSEHHNRLIHAESGKLVVFGGYGLWKYNSILAVQDLKEGRWQTKDLSPDIPPRYLASMGYFDKNEVLIFGGYGSLSGLQENSPRNFYDMYLVDFKEFKVNKKLEFKGINDHCTFSNSMVINKPENKFYTLAYPNDRYRSQIKLYEMDMENLTHRILADSIPYNFQDTESFCDLVYSEKDNLLYAIVVQRNEEKEFEMNIYSLMYPPLAQSDIIQVVHSGKHKNYSYLIIFFVCILITTVAFVKYKQTKRKTASLPAAIPRKASVFTPMHEETSTKEISSSILLLGGFQVFDKSGTDITKHFTPIIRQLFLICLFETYAKGKGISSKKIEEKIWSGMDKANASNNRNVNIRKLRVLLEKTGGISLQNDNSYWRIDMETSIKCDYIQLMDLLTKQSIKEIIDKKTIEDIIDLAISGTLLPNMDEEWFDRYKSEYTNLLIDKLLSTVSSPYIATDYHLLIKIANVVLLHDSLSEEAIKIKCTSLFLLGQKGLFRQTYDKYCNEYQKILNEPPRLDYKDLIRV